MYMDCTLHNCFVIDATQQAVSHKMKIIYLLIKLHSIWLEINITT